ncbi:hypothetical protein [Tropicimonas marinistellae]|uniref:hypothetical protein n=1 Tax=Tropicimonas marinistellae TaxID=1739787 RepID=UPI00083752A4|nr:hypothetical protein [Tropicimonas marinistellae]
MSDTPGGDHGNEHGGEPGGGGGGGHSGPEPHPTGEAGQSLDANQRNNTVWQAVANGQAAGSTTGPQAGIDINSAPAYMSVEAARAAAAERVAGNNPGYDSATSPMDPDYIAPGAPLEYGGDGMQYSEDGAYDSSSDDDIAEGIDAANPAGVGGLDNAVPLRDMAADAKRGDGDASKEPSDTNNPPYNEADAKESILRSKCFWGVAITSLALMLVVVFLVGIFKGRWFGVIGAESPVAKDINVPDQTPGKPVTIDITEHVAEGDAPIDFTSVKLVDGAGNSQTKLDVAGEGTWSVDATSGAITFTPQANPALATNPSPVSYQVADTEGRKSNIAKVTVAFTAMADKPAPTPVSEMEAPVAGNISLTDQTAGSVLTFDVPTNVTKGLDDVDFTSVVLVGATADQKKLVIEGKGTWSVDATTGVITFTPDAGVSENPMPVRYQVKDVVGRVSNPGVLTAGYKSMPMPVVPVPPTAQDAVDKQYYVDPTGNKPHIDPITFKMDRWVTKGSKTIDWSTLRISDRAPVGDGKPDGVTSLDVKREGSWSVDTSAKTITFTPITKGNDLFTGSPTPIVYWVEDVDGNRSAPAMIIANKHIGEIADAIKVMAAKDDATFWADYKRELIDTNLSLEVVYGLTYQLEVATDAMISGAGRKQVRGEQKTPSDLGLRLRGNDYTDALDAWTDGTSAQLLSVAEAAVKKHLAGEKGLEPLVERDVQLLLILRLLKDQFITLQAMRQAGGGQG